ncbi:T9SS type A sorting domain-containing protein [Cytophagaceae bacterium ABcell3]|nr:T9SS type A sorting domain-containing protein [Cytophagaceae bacterium ABcell3]
MKANICKTVIPTVKKPIFIGILLCLSIATNIYAQEASHSHFHKASLSERSELIRVDREADYKSAETIQLSDEGFELKIFPNPFSEHIYIEGTYQGNKPIRISLYNQIGVKLHNITITDALIKTSFHTASLAAGIYFLKVETEDHKLLKTHKMIKEHL